ncbi:MAG: hypothetical protein Q8927_10850 [Bacteroidota bacterium]|nr:hypothetical protein [Bacteroidota bacterium]MDP4216688.1 hypothetical protein [Bacteroidota bacterium]MDP4244208.1 hypothetical protein [Bacteroidota bacterium]MDP4253419.1 hypothetical protein [Bacteroidota bacterium]MDP4258868.1 hypothetical protein [Bacteroidota bacterium]
MNINIVARPAKDAKKSFYTLEWGRGRGQRMATGIFTFAKPANKVEKTHNKEAMTILEAKKSQLIIEGG